MHQLGLAFSLRVSSTQISSRPLLIAAAAVSDCKQYEVTTLNPRLAPIRINNKLYIISFKHNLNAIGANVRIRQHIVQYFLAN